MIYNLFAGGSDYQNNVTLSYDEEDDLDEKTVISLIDMQFQIGALPKIREEFNQKRYKLLKNASLTQPLNESQTQKYIQLVFEYELKLGAALERNLDDISDIYGVSKDQIKKSQNKYMNTSNSHKLLGRQEVLQARIPKWLDSNKALDIKHQMEEYASKQQKFLVDYLLNQHQQNQELRAGDFSQMSERMLNAEEIMEQSNYDYHDEDPLQMIIFKSTAVAKHLTIDMILEKTYRISEAQLKRMLYKQDYDQIEQKRGFFYRLRRYIFG